MTGYGRLLADVTPANLVPHPDNDGTFLIQTLDGKNLSCNSDGQLNLNTNTGPDEKWTTSSKCMINENTFSGTKYFFLEWFD